MKPIKLKIRGFLTYKEEIEIEFTKLYDKKVFLISGDTGSGKTSIFDAIQYALYGKVSRGIDTSNMRSDFLSPEDYFTYVNLIFEDKGKVYEIERIPSQFAKKTRAGQDIKNSVALFDITNERTLLAEKMKEAEDLVQEIIGLDYNQFSKVMLLAQGEFQQFLRAKSDERTKLLSDIFKTHEYKEIQDSIKEKASGALKNMEVIDDRLENVLYKYEEISNIISRDDVLVHDFTGLLNSLNDYENRLKIEIYDLKEEENKVSNLLNTHIEEKQRALTTNQNIEKYKVISENLDQLSIKKQAFENLRDEINKANFANSIRIYEKRLDEVSVSLLEANDKLTNLKNDEILIEDEVDVAKRSLEKLDGLNDKLNDYRITQSEDLKKKDELGEFTRIKKTYENLLASKENFNKIEKELEAIDLEREDYRKSINDLNEKLNRARVSEIDLNKAMLDIKSDINTLSEKLKKSIRNKETLEKIELIKKDLESVSDKKELLETSRKLYFENQRLREINSAIDELNQTGICPVCGDRHDEKYPKHDLVDLDIEKISGDLVKVDSSIASKRSEIRILENSLEEVEEIKVLEDLLIEKQNQKSNDESELETLRTDIETIRNSLFVANEKLQSASLDYNEKKIILENLTQELINYEDIRLKFLSKKDGFEEVSEPSLNQKINETSHNIRMLEEEIASVNQAYNDAINKKTKIQTDITNQISHIEKLTADKKSYQDEFDAKRKEEFDDYESYKIFLDRFENLSSKNHEVEEFFNDFMRLKTQKETFKDYENLDLIDTSKIDEKIDQNRDLINNLRDQLTIKRLNLSNAQQTSKDINQIYDLYRQEKNESEILAKLSRIADGSFSNVAGREKIDFETFVLTYYFDRVLAFANNRLNAMSNGQFTMIRKSVGQDARSKWGLDIELLDSNTGKKRPAATLSGGESFIASLSLALGLSDEIAAENGGITIDTLFIDEGFGTLSDDYLNKVIEQIEKLSYENKFIGIISHVKELKEAIDAKIEVTYTVDEGSFIEVKA